MLDEEISELSTAESVDSINERQSDLESLAAVLDDKPVSRRARHRAFVFTAFFNDKADAAQSRKKLAEDVLKDCRYAVLGIECCPTTGKVHIQGFALWRNERSFAAVREVLQTCLGKVPHVEPARGNAYQSKEYCSKEGDVLEIGKCPEKTNKQGRRNDIHRVVAACKEGATREEIAAKHPEVYMRYHAGLDKIISFQSGSRIRPVPYVFWLWGDTGSGKTRWATSFLEKFCPGDSIQSKGDFILGIRAGSRSLLLDDFRPRDMPFNQLLRFTDRYKIPLNIKGGHEWLVAEFILITCIFDIDRCFNGIAEDLAQLKRRVTKVIKFPLAEDSPWEIEKLDDTEMKIICARD